MRYAPLPVCELARTLHRQITMLYSDTPDQSERSLIPYPEVAALSFPLFMLLEAETSREAGSSNFILLDVRRWVWTQILIF